MKSPEPNLRDTGAVTRRSFIQTTGQTAALAVLGHGAALATVDKGLAVPSGKRIRVGIVGCGSLYDLGVYNITTFDWPVIKA